MKIITEITKLLIFNARQSHFYMRLWKNFNKGRTQPHHWTICSDLTSYQFREVTTYCLLRLNNGTYKDINHVGWHIHLADKDIQVFPHKTGLSLFVRCLTRRAHSFWFHFRFFWCFTSGFFDWWDTKAKIAMTITYVLWFEKERK